jgi:hypothetical protein
LCLVLELLQEISASFVRLLWAFLELCSWAVAGVLAAFKIECAYVFGVIHQRGAHGFAFADSQSVGDTA